jgi:hypothetical protein
MRILSLDELPAFMEQLHKQPPPSPEEIARRRKLSEEAAKVRDEMEPWDVDIKEIIRRDWLRKTE